MDGARLDPAMASDKDPAADSVMGGAMGVPVVHGLDKAGQVLDYGKSEAVGDHAAVAAHAEGLSKELGPLDPSLAVMMQAPAPASRAQTPPPPDVAGVVMQQHHGMMPLPPGAEGLLGAGVGVGVPPGGMLGALTAVPGGVGAGGPGSAADAAALSKVVDLAGGIKDDKMAALDAAGKLKEQKKRLRPDDKEELEKDGKKPKEGEELDKDMMAHKLCPHNKPKATCMECTGCPHGKRRQNCKDCNAGSRQWCQHGKRRHDCHDCSGCPHGRIKRTCKDCSGSGICQHGKLKRSCRECSTDMCVHKRRRYYCRDCQGAGACEHNNRRWRCRECNGHYTCEHGLIKTNCLQCEMEKAGPKALDAEKKPEGHVVPPPPQDHLSQLQAPPPPQEQGGDVQMGVQMGVPGVSGGVVPALAPSHLVGLAVEGKEADAVDAASLVPPAAPPPPPHGVGGVGGQQAEEDEANLSRVCMHKRWRVFCAQCGGSGLCEHGKRRGTCKTCGGTQFCEHKRLRRQCRICRPELKVQKVSLCPHDKRKARCRECGGSQFCEHGKNKDWCKDCGGRRLCVHQRQKHQCRECCIAGTCPHKRPEQCVGKSGKERGRPRIHPEKPKVAGARRGRPPKAQNLVAPNLVTKDLVPPLLPGAVDPKAVAAAKEDVLQAPAPPAANMAVPSMAVPAAPPPLPSDAQALLSGNGAWAGGGLAAPASSGMGIVMGIKEAPPPPSTPSPAALTPLPAASGAGLGVLGGLGAVKKDKAPPRPVSKKGKKGAGEGEEAGGEAVLGGEDVHGLSHVDPLYALSVHAVSASAKEKAAKDALKTGRQEGLGADLACLPPDARKDAACARDEGKGSAAASAGATAKEPQRVLSPRSKK